MQTITQKPLRPLYWSLLSTAVLAATLVVAVFWLGSRYQVESAWVNHTLMVRNQIAKVLNMALHAESSQRGYLLTGRNSFLVRHDAAIAALPPALKQLAKLTADNPRQQQAIANLRGPIADKLSEMRTTIDERKAGNGAVALAIVNADQGRKVMADIEQLLSQMEAEENHLLTIRQSRAHIVSVLLQGGVAVVFFLICLVGVLANSIIRRSFRDLVSAHNRLVVANDELQQQINQREHVEAQLRQSQKMQAIGQLTGGIAHDFNNMLGVIRGSLDLMRRRINSGDFGIERFIKASLEATERAAVLTHRLLAFSRQQPLEPEAVDANRMIGTMSEMLRSMLGEHIRIETVLAAGLWAAHADVHQLESALLNIAINARDAMPEGGKLTMETANTYLDDDYSRQHTEVEPGQYVMIAVTDTGHGMSQDVLSRVFDPFFTTKSAGKGTGLGLSQVYGFVKQSHGHIKIYSEIGAGTTVKIYLPRLTGGATEIKVPRSEPVKAGSASEVILVVEDDLLMRQLTVASLSELGYTVLDCENAASALAALERQTDIKLLFTDVVMPDMNGRKLADEALRLRPDLKVLFTTGYTPNAVVHGGVLDSGVNLLSKPFTVEQLAAKVRQALER